MDITEKDAVIQFTKDELIQKVRELQTRVVQLEDQLGNHKDTINNLLANEEKYKILMDGSSDPIFIFSSDGEYQYANQAYADSIARPLQEIINHTMWDLYPSDEAERRFATIKSVFSTGSAKTIEGRTNFRNQDRFFLTTAKPIFDNTGNVERVICVSKEITERKILEKELIRLSNFDTLTGLYNRHYFEIEMEQAQLSRVFPVSIIVADMDKLKWINDQYGNAAGDVAIQKTAMVIQDSIRSNDIAARIGGDEFAVLLVGANEESASEIVKRLRFKLHSLDDPALQLSIGFATGEAGSNLVDVFRLADERMYQSKSGKKSI